MSAMPEDSEICPFCGHKSGEYSMNQRALKPYTVLNGKYLVGRVLGEGGFGITYLGIDITLNLRVAIKEFFPTQFASRNVYESESNDVVVISGKSAISFQKKLGRYEAEARRLVRLESLPGIVRVLNFFYENNTAYMVMEYIPGQTLKEYREKNKSVIHWHEALDILEPIVKSLSVLHKNDIIHRDISPDNIMITDDKKLILIDFGTAVEIEENDKSKEIELKRGYAPPEQYSSHGNQGPWTDVYEICATIYYMILGRTLPDALAIHSKSERIIPISDVDHTIPTSVETAIMKGLNTDIKNRIQNMDELYEHLYNGRRIIPWKKIGIALVTGLSILAIFLVIYGAKTLNNSEKKEGAPTSVHESNIQIREENEPTEVSEDVAQYEDNARNEEDTPNDDEVTESGDTAIDYIADRGLKYVSPDMLTYTSSENGITITGSDYSLTDVVIPEKIDGMPVTSIAGIGANTTGVVLPDTLTRIEDSAFKNCVYLEYIFIPGNVEYIGTGAFDNCLSLNSIHVSSANASFRVLDGTVVDTDGNKYN